MTNEPKQNEYETYEAKEQRLDDILGRLDNAETPMDKLAEEASEAAELIKSMQATLKAAQTKVTEVLEGLQSEETGSADPF